MAGIVARTWLVVFVLLTACSGGSVDLQDQRGASDVKDTVSDSRGGKPDSRSDGGGDVHFVKPDLPDLPDLLDLLSDVDMGDMTPFDDKPQCEEPPYPAGCPCADNGECHSGWCVESRNGKICTDHCVEECPEGFVCTLVPGSCPDCEYICAPLFVELCRPCQTNGECQQSGLATTSYCLDFGAEGNYCGAACDETDCPVGYSCVEAVSVKGKAVTQCVPDNGECTCAPLFIEAEATTTCFVQNTYGKCEGERYCAEEGLTACDAPEPAAEVCDGKDNDCDGAIDEDEDICSGGKVCLCAGPDCDCVCPDGLTDCGDGTCIDTKSTVAHCGGCGQACDVPHVETYVCQDSTCKIAKCAAGYENYNGEYDDGCECEIQPEVCDGVDNDCDGAVDEGEEACPGQGDCIGTCVDGQCECSAGCDLCEGMCVPFISYFEDPDHCGYCGNKCSLPNTATHGCEGGNCYPVNCKEGYADCDGVWANGCEWTIEQEQCNCVDDDCDGEVDELPLADCEPPKQCVDCFCQCPTGDPNIMDCGEAGCKNVATDPEHCGWCNNPCTDMAWPNVKQYGCADGMCTILGCDAGFFDVNGEPWDGCECEKTGAAEECDLIDNDCDGEVDEAPFTDCQPPKVCEYGMCSCPLDQPNLQECIPNQCIDIYTNPNHCGFCDNACSDLGWPNVQQYSCIEGMCGILACQSPWFNTNQMDFDGCECEKTSPTEMCDMVDNNCNGEIDETPNNCIPPKICQAGTCVCPPDQPNLQDCGDGQCTDTNTSPQNCGWCGNVCALDNVAFQKCEAGECIVPGCKPGWKDCDEIAITGCEFEVKVEECNNFDDDCDGEVDENPMGINQPCDTGLPGLCATGITKCVDGAIFCDPNIEPNQYPEICDNKDNDCNGQVDDGNPGGGGPCSVAGLKGECKMGVLECTNGSLNCTQTVFPQDETCDGLDNDCDGVVDSISEPCFTDCGNGTKLCNGGIWGACSAMEPKTCKNYDNCQMEQMCVQQCPAAPAEQCNGMDDNCDGNVDETFTCSPGQQKEQACGNCGTQSASCTNNCTWGAWSNCDGQGVCSPGQKKTEGDCGNCGDSQYVCSNSCYWEYDGCINQGICSPFSTKYDGSCGNCGDKLYSCTNSCSWSYVGCENEGVCSPGATKYDGSCGNCGDQKWTCSNSCSWSKSSCVNQGACSPGSTMYDGSCGDCGEYKYSCTNSCSWSKLSGCYNEGVCSPGSKVACDDCKAKLCGSNCTWGSCGSANMCGGIGEGGCGCDAACTVYEDCCPGGGSASACGKCGYGCNSCEDTECGGSGGNCYCDSGCPNWGDCCNDARDDCSIQTCAGHCGEDFSSGCDCDWNCGWVTQGDCCADKASECD